MTSLEHLLITESAGFQHRLCNSINNMSNEYDAGSLRKNSRFFQNGQTEETDPGGAWNVRQSVPKSPEVSHKCQRSEISTRVKATSVLKVKLELMWRSLTARRALKSLFLQERASEQKK